MGSGFNSTCSKHKNLKPVRVPSATAVTEQMHSLFSEIEDSRVKRTRAHLLTDILIRR
ncbi:hypothetical protein [aff. Roholtiella sp. LEGE 12411]|uniref:hypothetical protein n=1 Tax=aff. Roholtiella sp. LEGE 12411 TaxID=1828822 RepID=UPI001882C328|nr:hypothetical protein [aff. Roholtiella sp. LEGE 12411]